MSRAMVTKVFPQALRAELSELLKRHAASVPDEQMLASLAYVTGRVLGFATLEGTDEEITDLILENMRQGQEDAQSQLIQANGKLQ